MIDWVLQTFARGRGRWGIQRIARSRGLRGRSQGAASVQRWELFSAGGRYFFGFSGGGTVLFCVELHDTERARLQGHEGGKLAKPRSQASMEPGGYAYYVLYIYHPLALAHT